MNEFVCTRCRRRYPTRIKSCPLCGGTLIPDRIFNQIRAYI